MQLLKQLRTSLCTYNALLPRCIFKCKEQMHNNVYPWPLGKKGDGLHMHAHIHTHTHKQYKLGCWGQRFQGGLLTSDPFDF